jgi:hypothetical protein
MPGLFTVHPQNTAASQPTVKLGDVTIDLHQQVSGYPPGEHSPAD